MQQRRDGRAQRDDLVPGRGPVRELLRAHRPVECVYVQKSAEGSARVIVAMARELGVPVKEADARKLDALCPGANHQGIVAVTAAASYASLEDLLALARERGEPPLLVVADSIEDPHNLGAIIRTAEAAGAHGLIIPKRRSAGLTWTVSKTSAGASEHLPVARVSNLGAAVDALKAQGVWIYAADFGGRAYCEVDYAGPAALLVGAEGRGVGRLLREKSDFIVSLPMRGKIRSLNASVAAGIILYEMARQRGI